MAANSALTAARTLDFRVLGPLEVRDGPQPVAVHGRKGRALLAFLLLHPGEWVSSDVLVDALWGEDAPKTARAALQNYVAQLRRTLGAEVIVSRDGGYELVVAREQIDLCRFERLVGEARSAGGEERFDKLREALALWRGQALADLAYEPFASPEAVRLEELRLSALEDEIDAELALGAGAELVGKIEALVAQNPFRERFPAQLMLALYRAGRQAEALDIYQQTRRRLLRELGIEPGTALRELEQAILRHDDDLEPVAHRSSDRKAPTDQRRKLVTILFADVAYRDALDPEVITKGSASGLQRIRAALDHHGAQIELRGSEEVMAVFGVPQAHEDDALRAARAALDIQADISATGAQPLDVRVGIETGEVLAGVDAAGHGFVSGEVVTQAKRLLEHAAPGEALVGETALYLLGNAGVTKVGRMAREPALVRLVDRAAPTTGGIREPPLVGRRQELRALRDAFGAAVEAREARLFLLLGEAGIGKTRLARELTTLLKGRAAIAHGRCLSYGQGLTYWPFVEALRTLGAPAAQALDLLTAGGATSASQLAWSVRQALVRVAQERPLLVVVEDLHWGENALLDLLESVAESLEDAPVLLLCLARPELLDQRPGWRESMSSLPLGPLARADCESLLDNLERTPEQVVRKRVLEAAGGNPLFLEELSAFVMEGGDERQLPPRIQILLQARLDLWPEAERLVLTTAALEGIEFHVAALEALLPLERRSGVRRQLATLTRGLVVRPVEPDFEGGERFRFRHQLLRDASYGALPTSDRARLHDQFADWVEQHSGGRVELEDVAAYHLEQAALCRRDLGVTEPTGEQRAVRALAAAAERARRRTDLRAAAAFGRRALALLRPGDPRVPELELELGAMLATLGHFDEALPLLAHAEQHTRDPAVITAIRLSRLHAGLYFAPARGTTAAIRHECAEAIRLFEQRGDHRWLGRAWHALGDAEWVQLRIEACVRAYDNAAAEAELAGDHSLRSRALGQRLSCLAHAQMSFAAAVEAAEQLQEEFPGEQAIEATSMLVRVFAALNDGRRDAARELAPKCLELFRRAGYPIWAGANTAMVGLQELFAGDIDEAERLVVEGIAELEQLNERLFRGLAETFLTHIRVTQGRHREALELVAEAERNSGPDDRRTAVYANTARARAYAGLGDIDQARAAALTAVSIANASGSWLHQGTAHHVLAETLAAAEEWSPALAAAEEAVRRYATLDRTILKARATALAAQIKHQMTLST